MVLFTDPQRIYKKNVFTILMASTLNYNDNDYEDDDKQKYV